MTVVAEIVILNRRGVIGEEKVPAASCPSRPPSPPPPGWVARHTLGEPSPSQAGGLVVDSNFPAVTPHTAATAAAAAAAAVAAVKRDGDDHRRCCAPPQLPRPNEDPVTVAARR